MRLIHISDPHLTDLSNLPRTWIRGKRRLGHLSWRRRRRHRHLRTNLDALCEAALALAPDLVLVTGDLTHLGTADEHVQAAEWLRSLGPPGRVMVIPGNHDLYGKDSWPLCASQWAQYLHVSSPAAADRGEEPAYWAPFPSRLCLNGAEIHGLNSGLPTAVGLATGALGAAQLRRLAGNLASSSLGALQLIALHHPPLPGLMSRRRALLDADALGPLLDQAHLVLHGHGHFNHRYAMGCAQVFATGSASTKEAPFRLFDLSNSASSFKVCTELRVLSGSRFRVVQSETLFLSRRSAK